MTIEEIHQAMDDLEEIDDEEVNSLDGWGALEASAEGKEDKNKTKYSVSAVDAAGNSGLSKSLSPVKFWDADNDGTLSWSEARSHYLNGNGKSIHINAGTLDLSNVDPNVFKQIGDQKTVDFYSIGPLSVGLIYGKLDLKWVGENKVVIKRNMYDFNTNDHSWSNNFKRNLATILGSIINDPVGRGNHYMINFYGHGTLRKWPKNSQPRFNQY
jgi:hypothetical protein